MCRHTKRSIFNHPAWILAMPPILLLLAWLAMISGDGRAESNAARVGTYLLRTPLEST